MNDIELYRFKILVTTHANDKIIQTIFNKDINEVRKIADNNIKEMYDTIDNFYRTTSKEVLDKLVIELNEQKTINTAEEIKSDILDFQNKNNIMEISNERFIEMLEYCKIKVPKACKSCLENINNNGAMKTYTMSKSRLNPIINALDKLLMASVV